MTKPQAKKIVAAYEKVNFALKQTDELAWYLAKIEGESTIVKGLRAYASSLSTAQIQFDHVLDIAIKTIHE